MSGNVYLLINLKYKTKRRLAAPFYCGNTFSYT